MTKHATRPRIADERGATMVVVALSLVFIISMAALSIDLGMLLTARAETQRAADAAALAGASEYLEAAPTEANAKARAEDFVGRNTIRGKLANAGEVQIDVDHANQRVDVLLRQEHELWFARIFRMNHSKIGAFASAHVRKTSTAACIGPFAVPKGTYEDSIGKKVLVWESNASAPDANGVSPFLLVGNSESNSGVGHDIYTMLMDVDCEFSKVSVGDEIPRKPGNNAQGNPKKGLDDLKKEYGDLTWTPDGLYDGFNKENYINDPRVLHIPIYDPTGMSYPLTGTGTVKVTGFLRLAILGSYVECQNNSKNPPCRFSTTNSKEIQIYGVMLPAVGLSDTCTAATCSETTRTLQLIK